VSELADELILTGAASYAGGVGYGDVYRFQVAAANVPGFGERQIMLSILAGDTANSDFLSSHLSPAELEIRFERGQADEPYPIAMISGFVDEHHQAWKIKQMRET
jgi:hypothetical protein